MPAKQKNETLWKISGSDRLQVWPKGSSQMYLSKPTAFMHRRFIDNKKISAPPNQPFDVMEAEGIESAGIALHKKNFYISRRDPGIIGLIYVLKGSYRIRADGEIFRLGRGMAFSAPAGTALTDNARGGDVRVLWFRLKNTPFWRRVAGGKIRAQKSRGFEKILFLTRLYAEEAYSECPSITYMQNVLKTLVCAIERDFACPAPRGGSEAALENIAADAAKNLRLKKTAAHAAKMAGMRAKAFNAAFEKKFGLTYAKYALKLRMEKALELLRRGETLRKIAAETGFADAYSLSNAFKDFYGKSPRNFLRETSHK